MPSPVPPPRRSIRVPGRKPPAHLPPRYTGAPQSFTHHFGAPPPPHVPGAPPPGGVPPPTDPTTQPYPTPVWPHAYNPAAIAQQAQQRAQNAIDQQLATGLAAIPTVQQQSAPFRAQQASETGLGNALLDALKGANTYSVNLATGVPQAFSAEATTTGGDRSTADRAAATLASFGTSAANQIAQMEAMAPAATASHQRLIEQKLQDLLTGPQGSDALSKNLVAQVEAQQPALELNYQNALSQQAQIPFNQALQLATANTNYGLAQQTFGLNQQQANDQRTSRNQQYNLQLQSLKLRQLGLQLQNTRDANSYKVAVARLNQQSRLANQRNATAQQRTDAAAARAAQAAITRAQTQTVAQANALYKRTQGTSGSQGTFQVHYFTPSGSGASVTLTPHTESFSSQAAMDQRYQQLVSQSGGGAVRNITRLSQPGAGGTQGQSVGYLRNQAVSYGVNLILQSAPWVPRGMATRWAQQWVAGVFGAGTPTNSGTPSNTPAGAPSGYPGGHTYP
jgi:hypothetical protein